ncbi:MAG: hypothetical protein VX148_07930 [Pseudomonadota bacterium]|nr:hypothetical protein [Pseudomonadota bacterium]
MSATAYPAHPWAGACHYLLAVSLNEALIQWDQNNSRGQQSG